MAFRDPPRQAAWRHQQARTGFEVVFFRADRRGWHLDGDSAAVEDGKAWTVSYAIVTSREWVTQSARVSGRTSAGQRERVLAADGAGRWRIDGAPAPYLDGCLDVDLESSSLTNAFPVRRLGLQIGEEAQAPAAYVRAPDLSVERLEQRYVRLEDDGQRQCYHYAAPRFDFECRIRYDECGLVVEYPGIAVRAS
jgi:hypothetical protein